MLKGALFENVVQVAADHDRGPSDDQEHGDDAVLPRSVFTMNSPEAQHKLRATHHKISPKFEHIAEIVGTLPALVPDEPWDAEPPWLVRSLRYTAELRRGKPPLLIVVK